MAPEAPQSAVTDLRPLSTGELIDRGFALYRRNFAGLLLLALFGQAPMLLAQVLSGQFHLQPAMADLAAKSPHAYYQAVSYLGIVTIALLGSFLLGLVMTRYISDAYLGRVPSVARSFRGCAALTAPAIWTCLLKYLFCLLGLIFPFLALALISGWYAFFPPANFLHLAISAIAWALIAILSIAPVLLIIMRLMVVAPVLMLESLAGWRACRRSSELVRYDAGLGFFYWGETRLSLLLLPLFVIELLTSTLTGIPLILSEVNDVVRHGSAVTFGLQSDVVVVGSQVLTYLAGALILPLYTIAITLFYYDVRIRREGFDLQFLAARLEARG